MNNVVGCAALLLACASCAKGHSQQSPDAGVQDAGPPAPLSALGYQATFFARALDVSCAPANTAAVEGCVALVRYLGKLDGIDVPAATDTYGSIAVVRTDSSGKVVWTKALLAGFDPIAEQSGSFIDDDLRVRLLGNGEFLVSGTYEGRVFIGTPGGNNQELGPSSNRNLFMIEFHANGTFDNWEDTGNGQELHALAVTELPGTNIVIAGTCQGDVPLDTGTFPCGSSTSGYLLTVKYDGSTVGALTFGEARPSEARDLVADAAGNLYVSGSFEQKMKIGTDPEDVTAGADDGFVMKLGADGKRAWIVTAAGLGHDRGGHLAPVAGGVLWTARVSRGARVGKTLFPQGGHVVSKLDQTGMVTWTEAIADAPGVAPLGVAAADDDSFVLYGDGFLGRYQADGKRSWALLDAEVRGAAFTKDTLVVAANVVGTNVLDAAIATSGDDVLRGALVVFPR